MHKLIVRVACLFIVLGMTTSVFTKEENNNNNENISGKVSGQRFTIIEVTDTMQSEETTEQEQESTDPTAEVNIEETGALETVAAETIPEETVPKKMTEAEKKASRQSGVLTARKGIIRDSPCGPNGNDGQETWYPTHPGGAVKLLAKEKGFTDLKMTVCREKGPRYGVRIISGYTPDGQYFENLIVVAADIKCDINPDGAFERGQFIETSLGPGLIVDFCERAMNERKYNGRVHIDLATDW